MDTPYVLLGASIECDGCGQMIIPKIETGTMYPCCGFELSFQDFVSLLAEAPSRSLVLPLIKPWAPEAEQLTRNARRPAAGSPEEKALIDIHLRLQANGRAQSDLYSLSMKLWR